MMPTTHRTSNKDSEEIEVKERKEVNLFSRAREKHSSGDYHGAIEDYTKYLVTSPKDSAAFFNRAVVKSNLHDYVGAISDFSKTIHLRPDDQEAFFRRGNERLNIQDYEGAVQDYTSAIDIFLGHDDAFFNRALAKTELGNFQGAISDYNHCIQISTRRELRNNARHNLTYVQSEYDNQMRTELIARMCRVPAPTGRPYESQESLEQKKRVAAKFHTCGAEKFNAGDFHGAIADYSEAIRFDPSDSYSLGCRAFTKEKLEDYAGALEDYDAALRINPDFHQALNNRAILKIILKDYRSSLKDLNELIRLEGENSRHFCDRGHVKFELHDYSGSLKDHNEAIRLDPKNSIAFFDRGRTKSALKDYYSAIKDLDIAIRLDSTRLVIFYYRALAKEILSDYSGAIKDYEQYLKAGKDSELLEKARANIQKVKNRQRAERAAEAAENETFHVWKIPAEELTIMQDEKLGHGGFGTVYLGRYNDTTVAIKELYRFKSTSAAQSELKKEAKLMSQIETDCIVRFYGISYRRDGRTSLVMEYCSEGSLYDHLHTHKGLTAFVWPTRSQLATDIANGLSYLHGCKPKIIHRDLKSPNVLISMAANGRLQAKLSDFGLAKLRDESSSQSQHTAQNPGTIRWMAPELLTEHEDGKFSSADTRSDVYALGMIFWELAAYRLPFQGYRVVRIISELKAGKRPEIPEDCPTRFSKLIRQCWHQNPKQRPSASDVALNLTLSDSDDEIETERATHGRSARKKQESVIDSLLNFSLFDQSSTDKTVGQHRSQFFSDDDESYSSTIGKHLSKLFS